MTRYIDGDELLSYLRSYPGQNEAVNDLYGKVQELVARYQGHLSFVRQECPKWEIEEGYNDYGYGLKARYPKKELKKYVSDPVVEDLVVYQGSGTVFDFIQILKSYESDYGF